MRAEVGRVGLAAFADLQQLRRVAELGQEPASAPAFLIDHRDRFPHRLRQRLQHEERREMIAARDPELARAEKDAVPLLHRDGEIPARIFHRIRRGDELHRPRAGAPVEANEIFGGRQSAVCPLQQLLKEPEIARSGKHLCNLRCAGLFERHGKGHLRPAQLSKGLP